MQPQGKHPGHADVAHQRSGDYAVGGNGRHAAALHAENHSRAHNEIRNILLFSNLHGNGADQGATDDAAHDAGDRQGEEVKDKRDELYPVSGDVGNHRR